MYYETNIDVIAEYVGASSRARAKGKAKQLGKKKEVKWSVANSSRMEEDEYDSDDGLKGYKSDEEDTRPRGRVFDPKVDMEAPKFEVMMEFKDHKAFQAAVKRHASKKIGRLHFPN